MPQLQSRAGSFIREVEELVGQAAPWSQGSNADGRTTNAKLTEHLTRIASSAVAVAVEVLLEVCVVVLYLLFLLLEGSRLPDRVRRAYPPERAEAILDVAGQVSSAIISYLRAKVKSSLALAIPVTIVLWTLGVKFALLWGILTFLCNFIPYVGSVIAYSFPVGFAFLLFGASLGAGGGRGAFACLPRRFGVARRAAHHRQRRRPEPPGHPRLAGVLGVALGYARHVPRGAVDGRRRDRHGPLRLHAYRRALLRGG